MARLIPLVKSGLLVVANGWYIPLVRGDGLTTGGMPIDPETQHAVVGIAVVGLAVVGVDKPEEETERSFDNVAE